MSNPLIKVGMVVAPAGYFLLTEEEKKEVCNGAGPKGIGWLVPDTIYGVSITEAANIHDFMYVGGFSKEDADTLFLQNMLALINAHKGSEVLRYLRVARAHTYYYSVKLFGGFFRKGN